MHVVVPYIPARSLRSADECLLRSTTHRLKTYGAFSGMRYLSTSGPVLLLESFRFESFDYEYDYEIRHFLRQLLASSPADVIKS